MTVRVCIGCRRPERVAYTDVEGRDYCASCVLPDPAVTAAVGFLAISMPYREGDEVKCFLGGQLYEGTGRIQEVSFALEHGGSPVYPSFRVALADKAYEGAPDEGWYTEVCLQPVEVDA